jgi:hypothetical protein
VARLKTRRRIPRPAGISSGQHLPPGRLRNRAEAGSRNSPRWANAVTTPLYPAAISRVALIGSFKTLQSALRFASLGRTRSVSQK